MTNIENKDDDFGCEMLIKINRVMNYAHVLQDEALFNKIFKFRNKVRDEAIGSLDDIYLNE